MKPLIHRIAAIVATLCVATFFISTIAIELTGTIESIQFVKSAIVFPGLFILIPAIAITGATGFMMAKNSSNNIIDKKKKRMPFIALNGLFLLIPAALFLNQRAIDGNFDFTFYLIQLIELIAGAVNLRLMSLNIMAGRKNRINRTTK